MAPRRPEGRPALERASSAPEHVLRQALNPSSFTSNKDEVIIEEKRRRSKEQEGYTIHRYRRGKMLGKGGFAKVYMCTALDSGKDYAVKIVPKANLVKTRARQKVCMVNVKSILFLHLSLSVSHSSLAFHTASSRNQDSPHLETQTRMRVQALL
jgi:serine/threonine protein kinase